MPEPEKRLWMRIRGNQLGVRFRRQYGIGPYIVDFYCPQKRLVIEVDGDSHYTSESQASDELRDEFINSLNIKILRVTNFQVMTNINGVIETILGHLGLSVGNESL